MLRPEYWERSRALLDFANEDELNVLAQQATKELSKRIDAYMKKHNASEDHKTKASKRKAKERAIKRNLSKTN